MCSASCVSSTHCIEPVSPHDGPPNEHLHCSMSDHACRSGGTLVVDGGSLLNPRINPVVPAPKNKDKLNPPTRVLSVALGELVVPKQHLNDPTKGLIYKPGGDPSQIILVPRVNAIQCIGRRTIAFSAERQCKYSKCRHLWSLCFRGECVPQQPLGSRLHLLCNINPPKKNISGITRRGCILCIPMTWDRHSIATWR